MNNGRDEQVYDDHILIDLRAALKHLTLNKLKEEAKRALRVDISRRDPIQEKSDLGVLLGILPITFRERVHGVPIRDKMKDMVDVAEVLARQYYCRTRGYDSHTADLEVKRERILERYRQKYGPLERDAEAGGERRVGFTKR